MNKTIVESNLILPKIVNLENEISTSRKNYLESVQDLQKAICTFLIENLKTPITTENLKNKITPFSSMDSWKFVILANEETKYNIHQIQVVVRSNSDVKFSIYENDQSPSKTNSMWRKLTHQDLMKMNFIELENIEDEWISTEKLSSYLESISRFIKNRQCSQTVHVQ